MPSLLVSEHALHSFVGMRVTSHVGTSVAMSRNSSYPLAAIAADNQSTTRNPLQ